MVTPLPANNSAMGNFAKLDPKTIALLLDVDGTLVDIAPSPNKVHVSDELIDSLQRLLAMTGGALALVSGRPLSDLDRLFSPLQLPAIGGHGAEMRIAPGENVSRIADLPADLRQKLISAVTPGSGLEFEDKGYSVALHYRNAPHEAERLRRHIAAVCAAFPNESTQLLLGKAMFEVKRPGINKGAAVRKLMTHAAVCRPHAGLSWRRRDRRIGVRVVAGDCAASAFRSAGISKALPEFSIHPPRCAVLCGDLWRRGKRLRHDACRFELRPAPC